MIGRRGTMSSDALARAFPSLARRTKWSRPGSNWQPPRCKRGALPIELRPRTLQLEVYEQRLARTIAGPYNWRPMKILQELCSIPTAPFVESRVYEYVESFTRARRKL